MEEPQLEGRGEDKWHNSGMTEETSPQVILAFPSFPSGNPLLSPSLGALGCIYCRHHRLGCFFSLFSSFKSWFGAGASLAQGGCWQGRGRVRFVGAVSSGTASPHAPACPLGLVSPVKCAVSWSTSKHATQLGVHKTLELQRLGLEEASDT